MEPDTMPTARRTRLTIILLLSSPVVLPAYAQGTYARIDGLLVSQMPTLHTMPVVYTHLDRLLHWLSPAWRKSLPPLVGKLSATAD